MRRPDILFVDDEPDVLELGVELCREAGYDAAPAGNSDIAAILLDQDLPFRLLITDIVMPGLRDGYGLARYAKQKRPEIAIIYCTGYARVASVRAQGAPYGPTVLKPWRRDGLVRVIRSLIQPSALSCPSKP